MVSFSSMLLLRPLMSALHFRLFGFSISLFLPFALVILCLFQLILCPLHYCERIISLDSDLVTLITSWVRIAPNIFVLSKCAQYFFINHFALFGALIFSFAVPWFLFKTISSPCILKAHCVLVLKLPFTFCPLRLCLSILLNFLGFWLIVAKKIQKPITIYDRSVGLFSCKSI